MMPTINETGAAPVSAEAWATKLGHLFSEASPANIPVSVVPVGARVKALGEKTVIEMKTSEVLLFSTKLPLQLNDTVRLRSSDGSFKASAFVIAVCHHEAGRGIAAKIVSEIQR
jgi:hypothetical protein